MVEQIHSVQQVLASIIHFTLSSWMACRILIICWCELGALSQLTFSPMEVAPVCRVGDPLELTCTASVESLQWSLTVVDEQGRDENILMFITASAPSPQPPPITVNSTTFTLTRISDQGDSPLISTLSIDPVSIDLNGTLVNCMDPTSSTTPSSESTAILIIDINQYIPRVQVISEDYSPDNVTVTVAWTQLQAGAMYDIGIVPLAPIVSTGNVNSQLTVVYNTEYNLSVVAVTPCGNTTAFITLLYANCGDPDLELLCTINNCTSTIVIENNEVPTEGSTVTFSCPPGLVLTGPNSATCAGNGEWEPDPNQLMCNKSSVICGHPFQDRASIDDSVIIEGYVEPSFEGAVLSFDCPPQRVLIGTNTTTCMGNGEWEPDPREVECKGIMLDRNNTQDLESRTSHEILTAAVSSSVVAFLVISVLTLATGVACGYYFIRRRRRKQSSFSNQPTEPLYEDVILNVLPQASAAEEHQEQGLKLKENAAYGTAKPTDPLHHEALPSAVEYHQEQGLDLKENVAYGTAKPTDPLHHETLPSAMEHHMEQGLELTENVAYETTKPTDRLHHEILSSTVEYHLKQDLELKENVAYGTAKPTDPLYHEALPTAVEYHLEQGLELKENVAYGTAKPTDRATDPLHHEALPSAVEHHLEHGLELKENVAYGTAKPTDPLHEDMNAPPRAMEHQEQSLKLKENVAYETTKSVIY